MSEIYFWTCNIKNLLVGVAFLDATDLQEVYDGVWGYNSLLTMAALSCVFYSFNHISFLFAAVGTAATAVAQFALRVNMFEQVREVISQ